MQKKCFLLVLLISISTTLFSQDNADKKDSSGKKNVVPKDRNMFGHGIPRGLIKSSDGLTDGYIMFSVPNSASVYLINRKGEVVHEWKGNYGGPNTVAYLFSSPHLSEIFIIDHSTTIKEAAGHSGGRWGKGGDFLYRWGNPENYRHGDSTTRKLFGQHDVRWIEKGKPGAGNLTVFNNNFPGRDSMDYSVIYELAPPTDKKGGYLIEKGKPIGPEEPVWTYTAPDSVSFWSSFISGAHRMNNGNTFINEGARGRFFEVTKEGKMVWEYLNPYRGFIRKPNGDPISPMPVTYITFRSTFIPADHPGLANKKLEPINPQPAVYVLPPPGDKN